MISRERFYKLAAIIRHYFMLYKNRYLNPIILKQLKNFKNIPIIIISFNQLFYLKQLIDFLLKRDYKNIIIIDNNSTFKPLLEYLESIEHEITIYRLKKNEGHLAFWKQKKLVKQYTKGYYVVTDPDIVPIKDCPDNFLDTFRKLLDMAYDRTKVGFSLMLEDIPETNPNKNKVLTWEQQFWKTKLKEGVYKAEIDTTFALYRPRYNYKLKRFTKAWRTDYPIQARHGGWYIDVNNLSEEQIYYMQTANSSASWQINSYGDFIFKEHEGIYNNT